MMRLAGTLRLKMGSRVEESWWTSLRVGVPRSKVPGVGLFQDDHAGALDARVVRFHGGGHEVGETHVGDEAAALFHLQHGLLALFPFGDPHLAAEHAGFDAHVGDGLGEAEGAAPGLAVFPGLGRGGERHVTVALLLGAALVDGREGEAAGQAAGGGAGVHPGQFEGHQRQRQVLRPLDEAALGRVHEHPGDAGFVEGLEQRLFVRRPLMGVAGARSHQPGHRSARHGADGLHQHLQVVAVGEAPQNLPDVVAGQGGFAKVMGAVLCSGKRGKFTHLLRISID